MEVRRGSRADRGALTGAVVGGIAGAFLANLQPCPADGSCPENPSAARVIVVSTLVLGAGIGALVGRGFPAWDRTP